MIRIPVVNRNVWERTKERLLASSLAYTKRMDLLHTKGIHKILGKCTYDTQDNPILWKSPLQYKRLYPISHHICSHCYNEDLRVDNRQGIRVCSSCGFICEENVSANEHSSFSQSFHVMKQGSRQKQKVPRRHAESMYKRCNHFKDVLLRIQGKEDLKISREELMAVENEVLIRHLEHDDLTTEIMKIILRSIGLQKYYNHCNYLIKHITGEALVTFTPYQSLELFKMFVKIQEPFAKHAPHRANMISYLYLVKKFCEVLGWHDVASLIPLLKSRTKVLQQDMIWKKICKTCDFPFIKSLL